MGQFDLPCFCIFTKHLVKELIPFQIVSRVRLPNTKEVPACQADRFESYARTYSARIIVNVGYNGEYSLPNGLDKQPRQRPGMAG